MEGPLTPTPDPHTPYLAKPEKVVSWGSAAAPITDLPWVRQVPAAALLQQPQSWGSPPQSPQAQQNGGGAAPRALCPAEPCSSGWDRPSVPQWCLPLSWLQGKRIFTILYYIFCRERRDLTGKAWTCAPSTPLVCSSMAGTHFHPHFSLSNPCDGLISWPHEATE